MRIRKCILTVLFLPLVAGCHKVSHVSEEVVVNLRQKGTDISSSMYGVFFEEINHAGDGGLYAELVQNRSFEEDEIPEGYRIEGTKLIPLAKPYHLTGEIRERSFEWYGGKIRGWNLKTGDLSEASMRLTKERPMYPTAPNNLELFIQKTTGAVQLTKDIGVWVFGRTNVIIYVPLCVWIQVIREPLLLSCCRKKEIYWHGLYYLVFLTVNGMI